MSDIGIKCFPPFTVKDNMQKNIRVDLNWISKAKTLFFRAPGYLAIGRCLPKAHDPSGKQELRNIPLLNNGNGSVIIPS